MGEIIQAIPVIIIALPFLLVLTRMLTASHDDGDGWGQWS